MSDYVNIVVCRHPQRIRDTITPQGGMDAIRLARWLVGEGYTPQSILHSGANRTRQAAFIMAVATDLYSLSPEKNYDFHYMKVVEEYFRGNIDALHENEEQIREDGGSVLAAIKHSSYARRTRDHLTLMLEAHGQKMARERQRVSWIVSHGQFAELAYNTEPKSRVPYGIGFCDAIIYRYDHQDKMITRSTYIPFNKPGETNSYGMAMPRPEQTTEA